MPNTPIENHPWIGQGFTFRADENPFRTEDYDGPGTLILGAGMVVEVVSVFENWNGREGLDMLYVFVPQTGMHTHVTPADVGMGPVAIPPVPGPRGS